MFAPHVAASAAPAAGRRRLEATAEPGRRSSTSAKQHTRPWRRWTVASRSGSPCIVPLRAPRLLRTVEPSRRVLQHACPAKITYENSDAFARLKISRAVRRGLGKIERHHVDVEHRRRRSSESAREGQREEPGRAGTARARNEACVA